MDKIKTPKNKKTLAKEMKPKEKKPEPAYMEALRHPLFGFKGNR